jgi:phosphoribosylformylglycinamidine (FGAM) synthase PurS component
MQKSTIPFFLISIFMLVSCASNPVVKDYTATAPEQKAIVVPYFSNPETDYVYKANINVYGNELSGIFIAKRINDATHRIVFTTEFGNKLMDFEISETDFKVNSIVSELDRKILLNTLKADFRLLLRSQFTVMQQFENPQNTVYKSDEGNRFNYLFVSKTDAKLLKIVQTSARKEKINISFTTENNTFAQQIIIQHRDIKLRIEFNYFKPQSN